MSQCIALLRGINVGRAKRLAMADLRSLIKDLGYSNVRTLLNSGNAVFEAVRPNVTKIAATMEAAIQDRFGFSSAVVVVTEKELNTIIAENPLTQAHRDPTRFLVAFAVKPTAFKKAQPMLAESWTPEAMAIGRKAAYLWCGRGIRESKLLPAFFSAAGDAATTRNWSTVLKLQVATGSTPKAG